MPPLISLVCPIGSNDQVNPHRYYTGERVSNKTSRELMEKYEKALAIVKSAVDASDPYNLVRSGFPSDEFESEITSIVAGLRSVHSEADMIRVCGNVFDEAFGGNLPRDAVEKTGRRIFNTLLQEGLIPFIGGN